MPAAPVTSPLPLEDKEEEEESVVISEPAPVTARTPIVAQPAVAQPAVAQPVVERTLEIRGNDMAKVAEAAAKLASEPDQTEVLVRSAMPASLQMVRGMHPASGRTPAAPQAQVGNGRPSSVAPVALDVSRPLMPVIPPMARVPSVQMPMRPRRTSGGRSQRSRDRRNGRGRDPPREPGRYRRLCGEPYALRQDRRRRSNAVRSRGRGRSGDGCCGRRAQRSAVACCRQSAGRCVVADRRVLASVGARSRRCAAWLHGQGLLRRDPAAAAGRGRCSSRSRCSRGCSGRSRCRSGCSGRSFQRRSPRCAGWR